MTDKKISELNAMTASEIANDDEIVISDTSATHTKKSAISELSTFFGINPEGQRDTVGAMFSSNTETGITATYEDSDGTIDLVVGTLNQDTTGSAATLTTARAIANAPRRFGCKRALFYATI